MKCAKITGVCAVAVAVLAFQSVPAFGEEYVLRAEPLAKAMPDGRLVPMWGFALEAAFGEQNGEVTSPGPRLTVSNVDPRLVIRLDNNLPVPISIVIPGQIAAMTPVRNGDGRARSFTHETPPGNTEPVVYTWENFRPGTYLYHSGTHAAVQVQMGLYGAAVRDSDAGLAYNGVGYQQEALLLLSEIDPDLHDAVAADDYGPDKGTTSTIDYEPQYFLINGQTNDGTFDPIPIAAQDQPTLLRFLNAGLKTRAPIVLGMYMDVVAEDGYLYPYRKKQVAITLPALKTIDALVVPPADGIYPVFDRRLGLTNGKNAPGGMLRHLVAAAGAQLSVAPESRNVLNAVGQTTFDVANVGTGDMEWTAEVMEGGGWLSITDGSSGTNAGTITLQFTAHGDYCNDRTGTIRVTAPGATASPQDVTVVQAAAPLPGDANGDKIVDVADLGILAANYGTTSGMTWADGDFTGDEAVDVADLGILAGNYGQSPCAAAGITLNFDEAYRQTFGTAPSHLADDSQEAKPAEAPISAACGILGTVLVALILFGFFLLPVGCKG